MYFDFLFVSDIMSLLHSTQKKRTPNEGSSLQSRVGYEAACQDPPRDLLL